MITKKEAVVRLLSIDQDTVIDENWFSYFIEGDTLLCLFIITNLNSYKEILDIYEGWTIDELLNEILNK